MLYASSLLIVSALFTFICQAYIAKNFSKIDSPSPDDIGAATNRLGAVMAVSIVAGIGAMFLGKMSAVIVGAYFFSAILSSISYSYFRGQVVRADSSLRDHITYNLRANFAFLALVGIYLGIAFAFLAIKVDSEWAQGFIAVFGVILGLLIMAISAPLLVSLIWGSRELEEGELTAMVAGRVKAAGLPPLRVQVLPMKKQRAANAMVTGLPWVPEPFRARIFLSDSLLSDFSKAEIDAIVAHEVAHFSEGHLLKRMYIPMAAYFLVLMASGAVLVLFSLWPVQVLPRVAGGWGMALVSLVNLFFSMFYFARLVVRNQELDADWMAINKFHVPSETYFSALDKIHVYSGASLKKSNPLNWFCAASAHPTSEERRRIVNEAGAGAFPPFAGKSYRSAARALGVMVLLWMSIGLLANPLAQDRSLASENKPTLCGTSSVE